MQYTLDLCNVICQIYFTKVFFLFFCFGEGNSTPLQYSCLENPMDREPGRMQSMGSLGVGHDWATSFWLFTFMHWRRKWQPTPVFLPGESQGWGAWWAAVSGVAQSRTRLKQLSSSSSKVLLMLGSTFINIICTDVSKPKNFKYT